MTLFAKLKLFNEVKGHSLSSWVRPQTGRFWKLSQHLGLCCPLRQKEHLNRFLQVTK